MRGFFARLAGLFGRTRQERDLSEELESHIQMHVDDAVRGGMTPEEARREAVRKLGGLDVTKEAVRDRRRLPFFERAWQDLRFAARSLGKNPGFAAVTIATLALGIGANTAIFTVVHAVLIERLPFQEPSRLVAVWEENAQRPGRKNVVAPFNYRRWQERETPFASMAGFYDSRVNLTGDGRPEQLVAQFVMPSFFSTLGTAPMLGRAFAADEGPDGNDQVVILSHGLWQRRFGGDPAVVGRTIQVDRRPVTIVGVMPPRFGLFLKTGTLAGKPADLWAPHGVHRERRAEERPLRVGDRQAEARRDAGVGADEDGGDRLGPRRSSSRIATRAGASRSFPCTPRSRARCARRS